jgi:hypothetical protein
MFLDVYPTDADEGCWSVNCYKGAANDVGVVSLGGFDMPAIELGVCEKSNPSLVSVCAICHQDLISICKACVEWSGFQYFDFNEEQDVHILFVHGIGRCKEPVVSSVKYVICCNLDACRFPEFWFRGLLEGLKVCGLRIGGAAVILVCSSCRVFSAGVVGCGGHCN